MRLTKKILREEVNGLSQRIKDIMNLRGWVIGDPSCDTDLRKEYIRVFPAAEANDLIPNNDSDQRNSLIQDALERTFNRYIN